MSNELKSIQYLPATGGTVYARIRRNSDGKAWNVGLAAFETLDGSHWSSYVIACAEQGGSGTETGDFYGNLPAGVKALFPLDLLVDFYWQQGGSPSRTADILFSTQVVWWSTATGPDASFAAGTLQDGAITEATITPPTEVVGSPTGILQLIMWVAGCFGWRRFKKDSGASTLTQYMADGTTVKTTSTYTSSGGVDTINKAT